MLYKIWFWKKVKIEQKHYEFIIESELFFKH